MLIVSTFSMPSVANTTPYSEKTNTPEVNIDIGAFSQQVRFKERFDNQLINNESGTIFMHTLELHAYFKHVSLSANYAKSKGSLNYIGKTQRGNTVSTVTDYHNEMLDFFVHLPFNIPLTSPIKNKNSMHRLTGDSSSIKPFNFLIGLSENTIKRNILGNKNTLGLHEKYRYRFANIGASWRQALFNKFTFYSDAYYQYAFDSTLNINFLSLYDNTRIDLDAVSAVQANLRLEYEILPHLKGAFQFIYQKSTVKQSERFPLKKMQQQQGDFFQPTRTMHAQNYGLTISYTF